MKKTGIYEAENKLIASHRLPLWGTQRFIEYVPATNFNKESSPQTSVLHTLRSHAVK